MCYVDASCEVQEFLRLTDDSRGGLYARVYMRMYAMRRCRLRPGSACCQQKSFCFLLLFFPQFFRFF